jgi:single-stranded DNA-specific DHH superfamily exonuclease
MYAAGMTIKPENYGIQRGVRKQVQDTITDNLRVQEIEIDAEINFTDITLS